ncbi:MAG: phosphoribosylamine--glycine ligase [Candidatus Delongbacteria bacterium]|jgi:phosphoribosylamine--glycine ligase|nr:phosphoribosylamine--glycine ligase [Candidatus Delongbacteria bacterium]
MKILVVGSGGREHSILSKLNESEAVEKLFCLPGNAGTGEIAENVDLSNLEIDKLIEFVKIKNIDLTVIGPEQPLIDGYADRFKKEGLNVFGPESKAALIEGSKAFSKDLMQKYNIPTAKYQNFVDFDKAVSFAKEMNSDMWIKASGLAAGKGAVYASDPDKAYEILKSMMVDKEFGEAGNEVVIEENMTGEEASIFAVSDGNYYKVLPSAQDHKAIFDGDRGPNTGGMGSYSPAPIINDELLKEIEEKIISPSFEAMKSENRTYKGVLFIGLMITPEGPKVIEYNCRFGDPETQVILPKFDGDLADLLMKAAKSEFTKNEILPMKSDHYLCLVLASGGYPGSYAKGHVIEGLNNIEENSSVIHAGTKKDGENVVTSGGRVLGIVSQGSTLKESKDRSYKMAEQIDFRDKYYRYDIGDKGIKRYGIE